MEHLETIKRIVSANVGKSKDELLELVLAELPSIDRDQCEKILNDILEKAVDVVVSAVDIVVPDSVETVVAEVVGVSVQEVQISMKKKILSFLKSLFLSCMRTTAVRVSHPPAPQASPAAEPSVDNELPPLEPSLEKV